MYALALVAFTASGVPWGPAPAPSASNGDDLKITLVTFGQGEDITEWFGHAALIVEDTRLHESRLYNYGEFSFDSTMLFRYALGHLQFSVGERRVDKQIAIYVREQRSVHVQVLKLAPAQRLALAHALADNALPENKHYRYDHYADNCSTRPRDIIDHAVDGALHARATGSARMTLRGHTRRHTATSPLMSVLIDFIENDTVDAPITIWDEAFLPEELETQVRAAGLVESEETTYTSPRRSPPATPPSYGPWLGACGVVAGAVAIVLRRRRRLLAAWAALVGLVVGIPGLGLALMWLITEHVVMHRNENLLLANPLTLLTVPFALAAAFDNARAARVLRSLWTVLAAAAVLAVVIKALPWFRQDNWRFFLLLLPAIGGLTVALRLPGARHVGAASPSDPGPPADPPPA